MQICKLELGRPSSPQSTLSGSGHQGVKTSPPFCTKCDFYLCRILCLGIEEYFMWSKICLRIWSNVLLTVGSLRIRAVPRCEPAVVDLQSDTAFDSYSWLIRQKSQLVLQGKLLKTNITQITNKRSQFCLYLSHLSCTPLPPLGQVRRQPRKVWQSTQYLEEEETFNLSRSLPKMVEKVWSTNALPNNLWDI